MTPDLWPLYRQMLCSRLFEAAVAQLWHQGLISGEMHLGTGEEGIVAGVVDHLRDGDAMALDHRGTAALLMRGVDPVRLLREFLGRPDGLCAGMGGHMHLFSRQHLAASTGIVGASGPAVAGFALAAQYLRPGSVAVAFFGEGAANQGMLLESLNLAAVWKLPVLFVCKDNGWSLTTRSATTTGGRLTERARAFGLGAAYADGTDVTNVWQAAGQAIQRARDSQGASFLHARCTHLEAHFLDEQLLRVARRPVSGLLPLIGPMSRSLLQLKGAPLRQRFRGLGIILKLIAQSRRDHHTAPEDPLERARRRLASDPDRLRTLEDEIEGEITQVVQTALAAPDGREAP
jgi:TPP-dependent pyruvate/acetoin dehydrogenase alpha subunit